MSINLNHSVYGAQFNAFCNLANEKTLSQDTLVSVDESGRGMGLLNQAGESRKIVVKNGDTIRPLFGRNAQHVALNNEVRELFKETVLKVCGARTLDELPKAVHDVMKSKDYDNEGHPLSLRRIRAVTSAVLSEAGKEAKSVAPQGMGADGLPSSSAVAGGTAPQPEPQGSAIPANKDGVESSVDEEEVSFKYAAPNYIAGLPSETGEKFMEFYCDAVERSIAEGRTKEECDDTIREMFSTVGWDKNDRRLLAEFLANGKPRFLEDDGVLPYRADAVRFAKEFKAVLDKTKEYRAKLPKAYGDIVADTILAALKMSDRIFDVDDLPLIDAEECEKIAKIAGEIDAEDLLSVPEDKIRSAKSLSKKLGGFQRQAAGKFAAELLRPNDSKLKVQIKQMLLMNVALSRAGAGTDSLAEEVEENRDDLVARYGMQSLLDELAPVLGKRSAPPGGE